MLKGMAFWLKIMGAASIITSGIFVTISMIEINKTVTDNKTSINDVTLTAPTIAYQMNQTYDELNINQTLLNAVSSAINQQKTLNVVANVDFTLTNNQTGIQQPNIIVTFTVTATTGSTLITGQFSFILTLSKVDISTEVNVPDLMTPADNNQSYQMLNQNSTIINAVITAINTAKHITVTSNDFLLDNNQTGNQAAGVIVTFTVTARTSSALIQNSFKFNDTLSAPDISKIKLDNPYTVYNRYGNYDSLNSDQTIVDLVTKTIKQATMVDATIYLDFLISNDQPALDLQTAGTNVTITVTAISDQIQGSFSFLVTLTLPNISDIKISDLQTTADPLNTYGALNSDINITDAVATAINNAKNVYVQANTDFSITNDQIATHNQVVGQVVTFTVIAIGNQITGTFNFIDTIGPVDISYGVTVNDPKTATSPTESYAALNTNSYLLTTINNAINIAKGVQINSSYYTLTNDQTGNQVPGTVVTFTVSATAGNNLLIGSFSFTNTMSKISIASGVKIDDLKTTANPSQNYGDLNNNQTIINAIINAIYTTKNISVVIGTDFSLRNNRSSSVSQSAGVVVTFTVTALTNSTKISGAFNFIDTLT